MSGTGSTDPRHGTARLSVLAAQVRPLLSTAENRILDDAVQRTRQGQLRVLVVGEAKRGKSTLVNRLFGTELLPTGALPVTSVATVATVGTDRSAGVRYLDGHEQLIDTEEITRFVSQRENPDNRMGVDHVHLTAPSAVLPDGIQVVDTPGTGSVHTANTEESARAQATVDLALFVVAADPPISAAELSLVDDVMTTASASAIVINKIDLVPAAEVPRIVEFTREAIAGVLESPPVLFPTSLRQPGAPTELATWLSGHIDAHGTRDIQNSTARVLRRHATSALDGLRVRQHLLRQSQRQQADTVEALRQILTRAQASSSTAADHIRGERDRVLRQLNDDHEHAVAEARMAIGREAALPLTTTDPPEEATARRRTELSALTGEYCAVWFDSLGPRLEQAMRDAAGQALGELREQLRQARQAAERTLDLPLSDVDEPEPPTPPRLPHIAPTDSAVWHELVTGTLVKQLPRGARRQRLQRRLRTWGPDRAAQAFGKARASLQQWLYDTALTYDHSLVAIHRTQLAALEEGIDHVRQHSSDSDTAAQCTALTTQIHRLEHVLAELDTVRAPEFAGEHSTRTPGNRQLPGNE
ncbi:dynamin family protein [Sciscionella marina]|uniref:dynamin family protein n=1 Tax=Sciscionella marina TaxID=508770 RepID=UPI0003A3930B|nr:dynamin family protein [Sciscionella marina]